MFARLEKRVCREDSEVGMRELGCCQKSDWIQGQNMHFAVAEGPRDTDIRAAAVAEGQYCLTEKPDLEIELVGVAADSVDGL